MGVLDKILDCCKGGSFPAFGLSLGVPKPASEYEYILRLTPSSCYVNLGEYAEAATLFCDGKPMIIASILGTAQLVALR